MSASLQQRQRTTVDLVSIAHIVAANTTPLDVCPAEDASKWLILCKESVCDEKLAAAICPLTHGSKERTRLMWAAKHGKLARVRFLIQHAPSSIDLADANGVTPLIYASKAGHVEIIRHLLVSGTKINAVDKRGRSALHHACEGGSEAVVEALLQHHARIDTVAKRDGDTPLIVACRKKRSAIALKLLASPHCQRFDWGNKAGETPLGLASRTNLPAVARALLARGANPERTTKADLLVGTPLALAVQSDSDTTAAALVEAGARLNTLAWGGSHQPLVNACLRQMRRLALAILKREPAAASPGESPSPLRLTFKNRWTDVAQALLDAGAKLDSPLPVDPDPLRTACAKASRQPLVLLMLQAGISRNTDCLVAAAGSGMTDAVSRMIALGTPCDAISAKDGVAALHKAAAKRQVEVCKILLQAHADDVVRDKNSRTPCCMH